MTIQKRLRVMWSAMTQEWAERKCDECGETWMDQGPSALSAVPGVCPICDADEFARYMAAMDERSKQQGVA